METKKIKKSFAMTLMLLFWWVSESSATIFVEVPLKTLCVGSNHIVIGRMLSKQSYRGLNGKQIYTDVTLEITEKIKGVLQKGDRIKLTLAGGTVDGITTLVLGGPRFNEGEESLLFISERISESTGQKYLKLFGLAHGKFDIFTDAKTNERRVIRDQVDLPLTLEKGGPSLEVSSTKSIPFVSLANQIRVLVR